MDIDGYAKRVPKINMKPIYILAGIAIFIFIVLFWQKDSTQGTLPVDGVPMNVTMSGAYVCLPPIDTKRPLTEECVFGLKADDGEYYMVNFGQSAVAKEQFDTRAYITAEGFVVTKEALSTDQWVKYNMKGIFTITKIIKVSK